MQYTEPPLSHMNKVLKILINTLSSRACIPNLVKFCQMVFEIAFVAFIVPPIGWVQHAVAGRLPVLSWTYPPSFVMMGQRVWESWPIMSKPRPLRRYIGPWRPSFSPTWLIYSRNVSVRPPNLYTKFGVDRVNLSQVSFILLFFTLC